MRYTSNFKLALYDLGDKYSNQYWNNNFSKLDTELDKVKVKTDNLNQDTAIFITSVIAPNFIGNADTATKLKTSRSIQIGNKSLSFDGSKDITYTLDDMGIKEHMKKNIIELANTEIDGKIGLLSNLSTNTKDLIVNAINEINKNLDKKLQFIPINQDISQNPETYNTGFIYSVEGNIDAANGHPYATTDWTHITYIIFGDWNNGNGYKNIVGIDYRGYIYYKSQCWNAWTEWQTIATLDQLAQKTSKSETIFNRNLITNDILTGNTFTLKSWVGVGHNLANAPSSGWFNYLCLDSAGTGSDLNRMLAMETNATSHLWFTAGNKATNWVRTLDTRDLQHWKHVGENYKMSSSDFDKVGFYEIGSLASEVVDDGFNYPDNNVGDYKVLALNPNKRWQTLIMTSPRYDSRIYIGRFWDDRWLGWTKVANVDVISNKNLLDNGNFRIKQNNSQSSFYTSKDIVNGAYFVDRWICNRDYNDNGLCYTLGNNCLKCRFDIPSGSYGHICQIMSKADAVQLSGKKITISAKCTISGGGVGGIRSFIVYQGTYINHNKIFQINFDNFTEGLHVATCTLPTITNSLMFAFHFSHDTAGGIIALSEMKVEEGDQYTRFTNPDYVTELLKCKRFWQKIGGWWKHISSGLIYKSTKVATFPLIVGACSMVATPTISISNKQNIKVVSGNINTNIIDLEGFQHASENYYSISFTLPDNIIVEKNYETAVLYFGENVEIYFDSQPY